MNTPSLNGTELDLHRLETPWTQTRVQRPPQVRRLMASIDADGQRVPLVVVGEGERFVLVDGYQRWAALTRLGRDTAQIEVWDGPLSAALVQVLARHQGRACEPIEQAWLLSSALAEGLSQRALATALAQDPSWVSRRLALRTALSEPVQEAVRQGVRSTWAARRVFVPLARANAAEAEALLAALHREPLSTRELATWYGHDGPANRKARTRMLAQPRLFIQALATRDAPAATNDPEAQWLAQLEPLRRQLQRLTRTRPSLLEPCPATATWTALRQAGAKTTQTLERLRQPLQESAHVVRTTTPDDHRTARQGPEPASDQSHPGAQPPHGAPGAARPPRRRPLVANSPALTSTRPMLYCETRGNVVRMQELRRERHGHEVPYSTLTHWVRQAHLREPAPTRVGHYDFAPGQEMQHDTSPHRLQVGGVAVTAQCAGLILGFSRYAFVPYYPRFTRVEAQVFSRRP